MRIFFSIFSVCLIIATSVFAGQPTIEPYQSDRDKGPVIAILDQAAHFLRYESVMGAPVGTTQTPHCQYWLKIPHSAGRKLLHHLVATVFSFSRVSRK